MPLSILYLIKLSISLSVIWLFYQLMLRRLTFYNLNRWYLLGYSLLSFIIPLINIGSFLEEDALQGSVIQYIPQIGGYGQGAARELSLFARLGPQDILWGVLLAGSGFLLIRLLIRWFSLRQVRRRGRLISDAGVKVFQVDQSIRPFSFGSAIYINPQLHTEKEYSAIILHEYVHIRQRHTVDILLSELLCIVNWYNPFVWLIRRSIRQNLEFIADRKVLEKGLDKKGYQYHLLQVVGVPGYSLATNFNFSSLKKRIVMMNKIKSTRIHLLKFLFLAPMLAVLLLAFREKIRSAPVRIHSMVNVIGSDTLRPDTIKLRRDTPRIVPDSAQPVQNGGRRNTPQIVPDSTQPVQNGGRRDPPRIVPDSTQPVQNGGRSVVSLTQTLLGTDASRQNSAKPLFIVDGVQMENWQLETLSANDIQSITVLKDRHAVALYGAKGANGVLLITTKKSNSRALDTVTVVSVPSTAIDHRKDTLATNVIIRPSDSAASKPLYYLDGVEISPEEMKTLNPAEIESLNVLKGESAIEKYGNKGRNGVILIQTKKKKTTAIEQRRMIFDDKKGERMTMQADSIVWDRKKGGTKNDREMVCFINGHQTRDIDLVEMLINRGDVQVIESSERGEVLAKFGLKARQKIMNIVTTANKDNPAAYMLASR